MADIPVEKKSSTGWLWALLALLLAALLLWWIFSEADDEEVRPLDTADGTAAVTTGEGTEQLASAEGQQGEGAGLMSAETVEEANRRSLQRIQQDPNATPRMFFQFNSAELTAGARAVIDAVIEARPEVREAGISITGFADRVGTRPYNRELSEQRAEQVRQYLVSQGLNGEDIDLEAEGETPTLVETGDSEREVLNRRVRLEMSDSE